MFKGHLNLTVDHSTVWVWVHKWTLTFTTLPPVGLNCVNFFFIDPFRARQTQGPQAESGPLLPTKNRTFQLRYYLSSQIKAVFFCILTNITVKRCSILLHLKKFLPETEIFLIVHRFYQDIIDLAQNGKEFDALRFRAGMILNKCGYCTEIETETCSKV